MILDLNIAVKKVQDGTTFCLLHLDIKPLDDELKKVLSTIQCE